MIIGKDAWPQARARSFMVSIERWEAAEVESQRRQRHLQVVTPSPASHIHAWSSVLVLPTPSVVLLEVLLVVCVVEQAARVAARISAERVTRRENSGTTSAAVYDQICASQNLK
jgi:hypothetical protein